MDQLHFLQIIAPIHIQSRPCENADEKNFTPIICKYPFRKAEACAQGFTAYPIIIAIKLITPTVLCRWGKKEVMPQQSLESKFTSAG